MRDQVVLKGRSLEPVFGSEIEKKDEAQGSPSRIHCLSSDSSWSLRDQLQTNEVPDHRQTHGFHSLFLHRGMFLEVRLLDSFTNCSAGTKET